jgi:isftu1 transposase
MLHIKKVQLYKERNEQKRTDFISIIKRVLPENLVFVDESGINRFLHREYCRAPKGKTITAEVSGRRFVRQSIVAAQCGKKIIAALEYQGTCNTILFNFWIKEMLIPELKPGQIVIVDNAAIHKSEETKKLIEGVGSKLMLTKPY